MELHDHIVLNSIRSNNISGNEQMAFLQQEINKLRREKEQLQQQLQSFQLHGGLREPRETALNTVDESAPPAYTYNSPRKEKSSLSTVLALLLTAGVIAAVYYFVQKGNKQEPAPPNTTQADTPVQRQVIAEYIVTAQKAFFYNEADENTRRSSAFAIPSSEVIKAYDEKKGFIYTELVNSKGQTSKGWLRRRDLVTLAEWNANKKAAGTGEDLTEEDISIRLNEARLLLNTNKTADAVKIYKALSDKGSDEASYQYANLALQNKHNGISCSAAFNQLVGLSNKGFTPAKRTVGFLYSFADDDPALLQNNYDRCNFVKDVARGSKLLMEAILTGDTEAQSHLDALNAKTQLQGEQPNP
jgi:serine/threonine-protein kinase